MKKTLIIFLLFSKFCFGQERIVLGDTNQSMIFVTNVLTQVHETDTIPTAVRNKLTLLYPFVKRFFWSKFIFNFEYVGVGTPDDECKMRHAAEYRGKNVGSSRVDLQACKLEYSIVSPK